MTLNILIYEIFVEICTICLYNHLREREVIILFEKVEVSNSNKAIKVSFQEPTICPSCAHAIQPILISNRLHYADSQKGEFSAFFQCPQCYKAFLTSYEISYHKSNTTYTYYNASKCLYSVPYEFKERKFEDCIQSVSPSFTKIYNQALKAEYNGLDEISGIGYRKSLEFLIKDFLIVHEKIDSDKVKNTALGNCINTMIDNPQLKIVASRATWLGNDQTHYEQKYKDKDIEDLKRLIDLSVHWITIMYLTDEAEAIEKK